MTIFEEVVKAREELYAKGMVVKALDDKGHPLLEQTPIGLQQEWTAYENATPEERAYWHEEHPGVEPGINPALRGMVN